VFQFKPLFELIRLSEFKNFKAFSFSLHFPPLPAQLRSGPFSFFPRSRSCRPSLPGLFPLRRPSPRAQPASLAAASRPSSCWRPRSQPGFPGPAQPARPHRFEPLTHGARVSAATSRRHTSLRPSRGRARGRPRLGVRAAPSWAHGPARLAPRPLQPPPPPLVSPHRQTLARQRRRRPLPSRRCRPAPSPPHHRFGAAPELRLKVRSTPVPSARVPEPCASPSTLAVVRRWVPTTPSRGPPPPSPARMRWRLGWIPCVASVEPS
jgi:hypothetical protein